MRRIALTTLLPALAITPSMAQEVPRGTMTQLQIMQTAPPAEQPLAKAINKALGRIFVDVFESPTAVSGVVQSGPSTDTDSDTNDPFSPLASNDTPETAQPIASIGVVGGYVSALGGGNPNGRFFGSDDRLDVYRARLSAGQQLSLIVHDHDAANPQVVDLDLLLVASNGTVTAAETTNATEQLQVQTSDDYLLVVRAFVGQNPQNHLNNRSNYTLLLSAPGANVGSNSKSAQDDILEGRFIVTFDSVERAKSAARAVQKHLKDDGLQVIGQGGPLALVALAKDAPVTATAKSLRWDHDAPLDAAEISRLQHAAAIKALSTLPGVRSVEPDRLLSAAMRPNDRLYPLLWHYEAIDTPIAWDTTLGANTVVAVVDTGIRPHDDLDANVRPDGFDFLSDLEQAIDGNGIDPDPTDPGTDPTGPTGGSFHGVHVAGTVAAVINNNTGIAGVAPNAQLIPIRALGRGGNGSLFGIAQSVYYAAGLPNESNRVPNRPPLNRADVLNLSLGGLNNAPALEQAVLAAHNAGVIVVAAAGNHGASTPFYPASNPGVVSVSALDMALQPTGYSGFGVNIDVSAPGGDVNADLDRNGFIDGVLSTMHQRNEVGVIVQTYKAIDGTSMATPHVAGVAALMKSVHPGLTPDRFDALLASGALTTDLARNNRVRHDKFGYGMMNAALAVAAASREAGGQAPGPVLAASPDRLSFDSTRLQQTLRLSNVGGGNISVQSIAPLNTPWLTIGTPVTEANAIAYPVTANPGTLAPGTYTGAIRVVTSLNTTLEIPVTLGVNQAPAKRNTGFQYVLAIDADIPRTVPPFAFGSANAEGLLNWRVENVRAGDYIFITGTDHDYDGFLCDAGEACGGWPSLEALQNVPITGTARSIGTIGSRYSTTVKSNGRNDGIRYKQDK